MTTDAVALFKQAYQSRPKPVVPKPVVVAPVAVEKPAEHVTEVPGPLNLRSALGQTLRGIRKDQKRTLRDVADSALISFTFLSEVERGSKECATCYLEWICEALDVPIPDVLRSTATLMEEGKVEFDG